MSEISYPLFWKIVDGARAIWCMFNATFYLIFGGLPCIFVSLLMLLCLPRLYVNKFVSFWASVYFKLILWYSGINIYVCGLHNIDYNNHYIFACNHTSFFDIPVIYSILPYWTTAIAKKSLSYIPVFGWLVKLSGCILIDRSDTSGSIDTLDKFSEFTNKNPRSILAFPEGRRSYNDTLNPFKTGIFILAIKTKLPVIPIAIVGCQEAVGRNASIFSKINSTKNIKIVIGKPIPTNHLEINDKYMLRDMIFNKISDMKSNHLEKAFKHLPISFLN